jgi:ABC-type polysaccharide/polyol phosphate transport system ATPase subunit
LPNRSDSPALVTRHLSKRFTLRHGNAGSLKERMINTITGRQEQVEQFWAVHDVSLTVQRGDALALIGRNGSGKSTLLKMVAGIYAPSQGELFVAEGARIGSMIELGVGFHGELTASENIFLNAAIHGLTRAETAALMPDIVQYSGLEHFMDVAIKHFSSGMHMRLGFAIAASLQPDLLLLDEVFAVGDADFQERCMATIRRFREEGRTILFVSHSPAAVRAVCDRAVLLDKGLVVCEGTVDEGLAEYERVTSRAQTPVAGGESRRAAADNAVWHRAAMGGDWDALGQWALVWLRAHGLRSDQFVLDVGCGSLPLAVELLPFMQPGHYWGFDVSRELFDAGVIVELTRAGVPANRGHFIVNTRFDLSESPHTFDWAIAHSLVDRLEPNQLGPCIAGVLGKLAPGGAFALASGRAGADTITRLAESLGASCERITDANHPRGEDVLILRK